jgi:hypothetical protein
MTYRISRRGHAYIIFMRMYPACFTKRKPQACLNILCIRPAGAGPAGNFCLMEVPMKRIFPIVIALTLISAIVFAL